MTGTKKEVRKGLMSLISDCEKGLIDLILTKSISRFCRNTTDCLELVRKLLDLNVCIYFEKENLNTGSMESELMLSILGSLAENESVSIQRMRSGALKSVSKTAHMLFRIRLMDIPMLTEKWSLCLNRQKLSGRYFRTAWMGKART